MIPLGVFYLDNYVSSTFILCLPSQGINFSTTWLSVGNGNINNFPTSEKSQHLSL